MHERAGGLAAAWVSGGRSLGNPFELALMKADAKGGSRVVSAGAVQSETGLEIKEARGARWSHNAPRSVAMRVVDQKPNRLEGVSEFGAGFDTRDFAEFPKAGQFLLSR